MAGELDTAFWLTGGAILLLLVLSGFFSGSETALTAASRGKLRTQADKGSRGAERALKITEDNEKLIGSVLLGNNLVNILSTSLATAMFTRLFGDSGVALATLVMTALVLIFVLGGGPVPAMIAIAFHTVGALGKLFSEVNENASLKPVEGLASVGATWTQKMLLGVVPQVAPNYFSYALLRFEINIRASAILGFVGAGGIGIFLLLFATIVTVDQMSSVVRDRLTHGRKSEMLA